MSDNPRYRLQGADFDAMRQAGEKFAMLTAYDYPTAHAAQTAGIHMLLVGDSVGNVVLGRESTRSVPLELMLWLAEAVRRAAPTRYLVADLPYESVAGGAQHVVEAAKAFRDAADCDAVKIEALPEKIELVEALAQTEVDVIAHLGLQPQTAERREQLKVQARNAPDMERLASQARDMVSAGAAMILLEAVPPEAAQSVRDAIEVPLIGCGAGPACDGFVVVTHDLLGLTERPPKFVPVLEHLRDLTVTAMTRWREMIADGSYPAAEHNYRLGSSPEDAATR